MSGASTSVAALTYPLGSLRTFGAGQEDESGHWRMKPEEELEEGCRSKLRLLRAAWM